MSYDKRITPRDAQPTDNRATRYNAGKPMVSLVPAEMILGVARAMTYGAQKYDKDNWRKGMPYRAIIDSLQRHLLAWTNGEDKDGESGLNHLDHAGANLAFLMTFTAHDRSELDDRVKTKTAEPRCPSTAGHLGSSSTRNVPAKLPSGSYIVKASDANTTTNVPKNELSEMLDEAWPKSRDMVEFLDELLEEKTGQDGV